MTAQGGGGAPAGQETGRLDVRVANLDCANDASRIERALRALPGVTSLAVHPQSARVDVSYAPAATSAEAILGTLRDLGFPPRTGPGAPGVPRPWKNPKVLASVASGVLLFAGWLLSWAGGPDGATLTLYLVSLLVGGYYFGREALEDLVFARVVGIELLMTVAAVVAVVMGEPGEGAMLAFLYSISEAAEGYTEEKTRSAIRALMDLAPKTAFVRRDGREFDLPLDQLVVGDVFIVRPGESIATDGEVLLGTSSVNQAPVTGESVPVEKAVGDTVLAGTINAEGSLEVRATRAFAENTIARIIRMVEEAQERKGASERFIERFGKRYSPAVLAAGVLMAALPPLFFDVAWHPWIMRATVFVVAAAPCALVISIPITLVAALGTGARQGVLIKGGAYLEALANISVVALDKTGTVTHGAPEVAAVIQVGAEPLHSVLAIAAGIESRSQHPLAAAVARHAEAQGIQRATVTDFQSLTGAGATARAGDRAVYVGSPRLFEARLGIDLGPAREEIATLERAGNTVIVVGGEGAAWSLIAIRDNVRPTARAAIAALRGTGVDRIVMLTGDNERTARAIAAEVGIDEVYAGLAPEDKAAKVRELSGAYGHVAMVGDGVNDAPALAEAAVGIAMGAAGTDVALETADVALMADNLERLVYALQLARRSRRVVRQNLALSIVVIAVLVAGAVSGRFTLPVAVVGHELSEFIVIASALRMLRA
ncbi:MAG: cation-translocating P-type ATPase [Gemmatimonadetes bacterium]|nr:cation-translocating P-type ATPase [Gemmatimonadota bacterium]